VRGLPARDVPLEMTLRVNVPSTAARTRDSEPFANALQYVMSLEGEPFLIYHRSVAQLNSSFNSISRT
jgi:hypothetical protein